MSTRNSFDARQTLNVDGVAYTIYSLPHAAAAGLGKINRLPFSLKVLLENLLRHEDGSSVSADEIRALAGWIALRRSATEIAYRPARVLMQDFTGVPGVVDLAAMRAAMTVLGGEPARINPLAPVDLVIDHSVQVDAFGGPDAFKTNVDIEMARNAERYAFLRWGQQAFENFRVVPPGTGICHQVNLEYLAQVVWTREADGATLAYPDTLVGTDSHTTMVNGLAVLGWGVGGIEAEAAMLGQPISMLIPEVVGFKLTGRMAEGATATDLVLTVVQMLRAHGVVGKFVEFYGPALDSLSLADRATLANMAPEYGATCGFFPIDAETIRYLEFTGREPARVALVVAYARAQGMWRDAETPDPLFTDSLELDISTVEPSLAGPKRPQDRVALSGAATAFDGVMNETFARAADWREACVAVEGADHDLGHGDVVIAAITSCTNTSNPSVMLAAGLLARNARARGLTVKPWVKTSLAPGSKVVTEYLDAAGLTADLDALGFNLVGYGCTTCIGNSGPLPRADREGDHRGRPRGRRRALGQPQFRGPDQRLRKSQLSRLAAARRGLRHRRLAGHRRDHGPAGHGHGRHPGLLARRLAVERGYPRGVGPRAHPGHVPVPVWRRLLGRCGLAGDRDRERPDLWLGRRQHLRQAPALFRGHGARARRDSRHQRRAPPRHPGRLDHHRSHLARGRDRGGQPRGRPI